MRGQVRYMQVRQNQKPAVIHNLRQVLLPALVAPSDPLIPWLDSPGRRRKRQSTQPSLFFTSDQISDLTPAQRSGSQIVVAAHQLIPYSRFGSISALDE